MGTLAGGFGYLLGLGWYPIMIRLSFSPLVKMKVSIIWSLAALTVSLASVVFGTFIALRRSLSLTPSFRRRWRLLTKKSEVMDNWTIPLPLVLTESEIPGFLEFAKYSLKRHLRTSYEAEPAVMIKEPGIEDNVFWSIVFWHTTVRGLDVTRNSVQIIKDNDSTYTTRLHTYGHRKGAETAAIITRKVIIEWNTQKTSSHTRSHDN